MKRFIAAVCFLATVSANGQTVFVPRQLKAIAVAPSSSDIIPWNDLIAYGYIPYHRLTRADFAINDKMSTHETAMSTLSFFIPHYKYACSEEEDHVIARITDWKIVSGIDRNKSSRKSWFKDVERGLVHEQGHLDINELHSRRLANIELDKLPVGKGANDEAAIKDLSVKVDTLVNKFSKACENEQQSYDAKTGSIALQSKQKKATAALQVRLKQAGISY